MFAAWTILGSITLVTSLNSRTCSPATAAVEAAIKLAAPNRNLEKQVRLLRMVILPHATVMVSIHSSSAIDDPQPPFGGLVHQCLPTTLLAMIISVLIASAFFGL